MAVDSSRVFVPAHVRVAACRSLWRSRFGVEPSDEDVCRVTGLKLEIVLGEAPPAPPRPRRTTPVREIPVATQHEGTETLRCQYCGRSWQRRVVRGRKPRFCPECQ